MGWKDKLEQGTAKAREAAEAGKARLDERAAEREAQDVAAVSSGAQPLLVVISHDEGRNARVSLYADRIERVQDRSMMSLSRARQDAEVIPLRSVSSVQAKKKGIRTNVTVYATGNTIVFRLGHDEARQFKDEIARLLLARESGAPAAPAGGDVAAQIRQLAELRDQGLLTEEEFAAKKQQLLGL